MVLPLIPAVLIAVGAVTGGGGLALGGKGALDFKKAQASLKDSANRYQARRTESEARVAQSNELLKSLGEDQKEALVAVVLRMAEFLRRNEKQVRENERLLVDGIDATLSRIPNLTGLDINAVSWIAGALGSAATAAGTSAGITAAVGTFGVASTGAAISGLSGVAAESATLAFLGVGALPLAAAGWHWAPRR